MTARHRRITTAAERRLEARARFIGRDHQRILQQLARLRVATASQLQRLCEPLCGTAPQTAHERLTRMIRHGLLRTGLARPSRGAYSPVYYQLTVPGLAALQREHERYLAQRPRQHILEYLIFRSEVHATVRAAGWYVASPDVTPEAAQPRYLAVFARWAKRDRQRHLERLSQEIATPACVLMAAQLDAERVEKFLPSSLTFEFIVRLDEAREPVDLALLIVDDPRRSIRAQLEELPGELHPGMRIVLRDHKTHYDTISGRTYKDNPRLAEWRLALEKRYPSEPASAEVLLAREARDPLFPDLWAIRTGAPRVGCSPERERRTA